GLELRPQSFSEGEPDRRRLEPRLGQLALGVGVGDDAAARVPSRLAAGDDGGADRQAELQIAAWVHEAEGAGVDAARRGLELGDDLHGAYLRGAGDRAAREDGAEERGEI